ncbi:MAG: sporulation membrane protein YtaF [Firmicutes bacterium]|nr:sporulation membrane protein YtaF [Bacillota bacterium]
MIWISVLVLAIAVSFDSLALGITYGLNRITIPLGSKLVLSLISGCSVLVAMAIGWILEQQISSSLANIMGAIIFILLGIYNLWRSYRSDQVRILINWRIPFLGLIIQVLQEPLSADTDQSQTITGVEAFILGGALALDAIGAGFGAAMLSLPIVPTTIAVMLASFVFISKGLQTGASSLATPSKGPDLRWMPGVIVISLGILKIIF